MIIKIFICIGCLITIIFSFASCRVASLADDYDIEDEIQSMVLAEKLVNKQKVRKALYEAKKTNGQTGQETN